MQKSGFPRRGVVFQAFYYVWQKGGFAKAWRTFAACFDRSRNTGRGIMQLAVMMYLEPNGVSFLA